MSCPLHQTSAFSAAHFQNVQDSNPTHDPNVTPDSHLPWVVLQGVGLGESGPTLFFPHILHNDVGVYDENLDDCQECLALYHDIVRKDPGMAISLADLPVSGGGTVGAPDAVEAIPPIANMEKNINSFTDEGRKSEFFVEEVILAANASQPMPPASGPHARRRLNHTCVVCGHPHDRAERARDCANKDRGLTPHACGGQCGITNCINTYSFAALLREHIAPPQNRDVECPQCLRIVRRKNIARHQRESCY